MARENPIPVWKYVRALAPAILFLAILVGWLASLLWERSGASVQNDEANIREWIDEARAFRKTLPELIREYLRLQRDQAPELDDKHEEIEEQIKAMADPIRMYQGQLPMFPEVFRIEVKFTGSDLSNKSIVWDSQVPRPGVSKRGIVREITHPVRVSGDAPQAQVVVQYRLHAYSKIQRENERRETIVWAIAGVLIGGSTFALLWVYLFLRRERKRELAKLEAEAAREHAENSLLVAKAKALEVEREADEINRKLLEQRVESAKAETRAAEAERSNSELKSQLFASIGIMAGSYAHNIKNLLVRPNDLLSRCLESNHLKNDDVSMLTEVKSTLGTVTERLQMILRTVQRDPNQTEMTKVDLNRLLEETKRTWTAIGWDKWKLNITIKGLPGELLVDGDYSHLQQALENLVFNARDATFEMRNDLRDRAKNVAEANERKNALIQAAAWKGEIEIRVLQRDGRAVLEVSDNGIGMTPEIKQKCLQAHFTTKRDNALFEGLSAGMGLGLSFVAAVLEHHRAVLTIDSEPRRGTTFRITFPKEFDFDPKKP